MIGCGLIVVIIIILLAIDTSPPNICDDLTVNRTCWKTDDDEIINRTCWKADDSSRNLTPFNFSLQDYKIFVTHTKEKVCKCYLECLGELKRLQSADMSSGLPDIKYNFLVGGTGSDVRVYEGQGWKYSSSNESKTIQVALIGNFDREFPLAEMCEEVKNFIEYTVKENNWACCNLQIDDGLNATGCSMKPTNCIQPKEF